MDERDGWLLCIAVALLGVSAILTANILKAQHEAIMNLDDDVTFLKVAIKAIDERTP